MDYYSPPLSPLRLSVFSVSLGTTESEAESIQIGAADYPPMVSSISSDESDKNKDSEPETNEKEEAEEQRALTEETLAATVIRPVSPSMANLIAADESEKNRNSESEILEIDAEELIARAQEFLALIKPPETPSMVESVADVESRRRDKEPVEAPMEEPKQLDNVELRAVTKEFLATAKLLATSETAHNAVFSPVLISMMMHAILELNRFLFGPDSELQRFFDSRSARLLKPDLVRDMFPVVAWKQIRFNLQFWCSDAGFYLVPKPDEELEEDVNLNEKMDELFIGFSRLLVNKANALDLVNQWIERHTEESIKSRAEELTERFSSGHPPAPDIPMIIAASVLVFNGVWLEKFEASVPAEHNFYTKDGSHVTVPYMTSNNPQFINVCEGFKVLGIPYEKVGEDQYFMYILLPDAREGLKDLIEKISSGDFELDAHLPTRRKKIDTFRIPMFNLSFGCEDLNVLNVSSFGLPPADKAVGIEQQNTLKHFSLCKRLTLNFGMDGSRATSACSFSKKMDFIADHPFLFLIKKVNGLILFMGHVRDPTAGQQASRAGQVETNGQQTQPSGLKSPTVTDRPSGLKPPTVIGRPRGSKTPEIIDRRSGLKSRTGIPWPSALKSPTVIDRPSALKSPTTIPRPTGLKTPTMIARPSGLKTPTKNPNSFGDQLRDSFPGAIC
ncbi:Serpin-ZX-like protein [Drosera capensis]